jgi:hypothetical protein
MSNLPFDEYEEESLSPKDRANDPNRRPHINYKTYKTLTEEYVKPGSLRVNGKRAGEWDPERY